MRSIQTILLFFLCITANHAQVKKVAMLETITVSEDVGLMVKNMVRGELTKSISMQTGFEAFTRMDIDQMMKEMNFQESGMVSEEGREKLGAMSGADYVCVSKVTRDNQSYYLEGFLIDLQTGRIENPATSYVEGSTYQVNQGCRKMAMELVGLEITEEDLPQSAQIQGTEPGSYSPTIQIFSNSKDPVLKTNYGVTTSVIGFWDGGDCIIEINGTSGKFVRMEASSIYRSTKGNYTKLTIGSARIKNIIKHNDQGKWTCSFLWVTTNQGYVVNPSNSNSKYSYWDNTAELSLSSDGMSIIVKSKNPLLKDSEYELFSFSRTEPVEAEMIEE
ncbi:hypothetical protein [Flammeovirga aprica]|uniref:DUF4412 domain-containing protein n=1 Tax=Flammeovirga aprica JL-4 TaxID=694437 RepID=A0A7X9XBJ9_9BACT|nr:hypothetical protein [Flammeovirga aprica]NME70753.1 hypothetical protein [Flammeovirga aprica JL-4]